VVPEFDQARVLVSRLPAAAAEVMLRRTEYVLKISNSQHCKASEICVDVFRAYNSTLPSIPEQQWKISSATGLPTAIRYMTASIGHANTPIWREVYFFQYATESGLNIPVSIGMILQGKPETWTVISFSENPGFDTSKFDREASQ
jgi:hypothetical protein